MSGNHPRQLRGSRIALLALAALVLLISAASADPTPVTITLINGSGGYQGCTETTLSEHDPSFNFGASDETFWVQKRASDDWTGVIRFDLTGQLPAGACIKSAKLRLYQWQNYNMSGDYLDIAVYRCFQQWDEGTGGDLGQDLAGACWYCRKTSPSQVYWTGYGARGSNSDRHDTYDDKQRCVETTGWVEWDVTPSVQYWARNPSENYGLVLDWTEVGITTAGVNFRTSEWGSERPQLVITYVVPTAEPVVTLTNSGMSLNYFNSDANITATGYGEARMTIGGTTSVAGWGADGTLTTATYNDSCECSVKVKLEDGVVNHTDGTYSFRMWISDLNYVQLAAIWGGYYEMSGQCVATGMGERHDGTAYWSSYWDGGNSGIRLFSSTPENEETDYLTWKLRYDKTNQMFYVYVNDVLVTYYSGVNFSNFKGSLTHKNDLNGVATMIRNQLYDETTPPTPNPMTWLTQPYATSTSIIAMTSSTATDTESPPVEYSFEETTGNPGGTSSGWQSGTPYSDSGLNENTQYGYKVRARDSAVPPNNTGYSSTVSPYTLIAAPTGITASNVQPNTMDVTATGMLPNLNLGSSGVYFDGGGVAGLNAWIHSATDTATGLSANTQYPFKAKARNGNAIETSWCSIVNKYSGMPTPTGCKASNVQTTTVDLLAQGSFPNLTLGQSGIYFSCPGAGGINTWIQQTTDQANPLTPNTKYTFQVKARNGDAVETPYALVSATVTTLAAQPTAQPYQPVGCTTVGANWGANGNPADTEYFCREETTGRESDWIVGTSWLLRDLEPNTDYRVFVKARNREMIETAETDLGTARTLWTIGMAKRDLNLHDPVRLSNKIVTAVFPDKGLFFIQDAPVLGREEGPSGIAVRKDPLQPLPMRGELVDVLGTMELNDPPHDEELVIVPGHIHGIHVMIPMLTKYSPNNRDLGGEDYGIQKGTWQDLTWDPPVYGAGLNTIGRLVKAWGRFRDGGLGGAKYFWLDDGSKYNDGTCTGVRVDLTELGGAILPPFPDYCIVTGIMRCMMIEGPDHEMRNINVIWPRDTSDIFSYFIPPPE